MKVIIDQSTQEDIILEENFEPTFSHYTIYQGENKIQLSEFQLDELIRAAKMFLLKYE